MHKKEVAQRMRQALVDEGVPNSHSAPCASLISKISRIRGRLGKSIKKQLKKIEGQISRPFRRIRNRLQRPAQQQLKVLEQLHQMVAAQGQRCCRLEENQKLLLVRQKELQQLLALRQDPTDACRREAA